MIRVNIDKAKQIAHDMRRAARADEFAPHDRVIAAQIPGTDAAAAEQARSDIRLKYALVQDAIELATDVDGIKAALEGI